MITRWKPNTKCHLGPFDNGPEWPEGSQKKKVLLPPAIPKTDISHDVSRDK